MKHYYVAMGLLVAYLVAGPAKGEGNSNASTRQYPSAINYQSQANVTQWTWDDTRIGPLGSLKGWSSPGDYDISILIKHDTADIGLSVFKGELKVYSWTGNRFSVYAIAHDRLYYADYYFLGHGGTIIAVDLKTGAVAWRSKLIGLSKEPPIMQIRSTQLLNLTANSEVVEVFGNESGGRYVEFKDAQTGETVGHKVYPNEPASRPSAP